MPRRLSAIHNPSMPALVSPPSADANSTISNQSFPVNFRLAMRRIFRSNSTAGSFLSASSPTSPIDRKGSDEQSNSKSATGGPSTVDITTTVNPIDLVPTTTKPLKPRKGQADTLAVPGSSPPTSFRQKLRPKSMQNPSSSSSKSSSKISVLSTPSPPASSSSSPGPVPVPAHRASAQAPQAPQSVPCKDSKSPPLAETPQVNPAPTPDPDSAPTPKVNPTPPIAPAMLLPSSIEETKLTADRKVHESPQAFTQKPLEDAGAGGSGAQLDSETPIMAITSTQTISQTPFPVPPTPTKSSTLPPGSKTQLRLRVDSASLPPSLPLPSPFSPFLSQEHEISGLPSSSGVHPLLTPHPPGSFSYHSRSATLPSPGPGPMSPRLIHPGTYVIPGKEERTLKMTPSLVMTRPSQMPPLTKPLLSSPPPAGGSAPMRYPELLLSGTSGGSDIRSSNSAHTRMRSGMPALRRDGSSFYMPMPPAQAFPQDQDGEGSGSDDEANLMPDEGAASDDEGEGSEETHREAPPQAALKSPLSKVVKAMTSPFTPSGSSSGGSYFRPRGEVNTGRRDRERLASQGAPSVLLGTVEDDHDGEARHHQNQNQTQQPQSTHTTPRAKAVPVAEMSPRNVHPSPATSNRDTIYHTPLATPSALSDTTARESVYYDADEAEMEHLHATVGGSTFTTTTLTSSLGSMLDSTVSVDHQTRPPAVSVPSAMTIKPEDGEATPKRPTVKTNSSGGSGDSALGLNLTSTPSSQPSSATSQRNPLPLPSADYFSSKLESHGVDTVRSRLTPRIQQPMGTLSPRTPGGRPAMYIQQVSHSMLDFCSMGMPDSLPPLPTSQKGKQKEGTPVMTPASPTRSPPAALSRRRSLPDMSGMKAPPPPYPKFSVREEEGREVLPGYSCRIHFEASLSRKMEFSSPGILAKDRAWKRVYIILNGTGLWIYKHNPRSNGVKPGATRSSNSSVVYPPGGRKGDGVVDVNDVVVGAPHVHLPEGVLAAAAVQASVPLRKSTSRTSSGNSGETRRRSTDGSSASRRSVDLPHGRTSNSRTSFSSSSNTGMSSSTTLTTPEESNEKTRIVPPPPVGASALLGQARPSNSQSVHPHAGSHILASLQSNTVLRQFSLQNAETGLASDYHKRKNVIRVRADGEQFLIQADNVLMAIDWIETFQAGANVALDLDERPMVKVAALPRRRRRRRAPEGSAPSESQPATEPSTATPPRNADRPQTSSTTSSTTRFFSRRSQS